MGAFGLATNLGIEQKAARDYIERYFARFAGVKRYMDETKRAAAARGYVETMFGRRIVLPSMTSAIVALDTTRPSMREHASSSRAMSSAVG